MPDIDPGYGGYAATNRLLAAASNTPEVANQWAQNRLLQTANQSQQFDLSRKKLGALNDLMGGIGANPTAENAQARIMDAVKMGVLDPETGRQGLGEIAQLGGDPAKIRQYAFEHQMQLADHQQRMDATYGAPSLVNTGGALVPMVTKQGSGAGVYGGAGGAVPLEQSPAELAAPRSWTDSQGVTHQGTQRQYQGVVGDPAGKGYGAVAANKARVVNGRIVYDGAKTADGKPQATDAAGNAVAANGQPTAVQPGIAGPAPGVAQAAGVTAEAGAAMGNALTKQADASSGARAILSNMQDQLDQIATGPGAERVNTARAGANAVADMVFGDHGPRFDRKAIAATEEFHKNSELLAQQQQQSLGGTDAGLASGKASVPNLGNSTMGNKAILAMLKGNQDAIEAKNSAWQDWQKTHGSGSYGQFAAEFNKNFSPRAFQFYHMDKADRQAMVDHMDEQDRKALAGALDFAQSRGWIRK